MDAIETLQNLLKRLPGMGEKSAARLCYHLIRTDDSYNKALAEAISQRIVEEPQDVLSIASSGAYNGLFHVLGGAINPLGGVGPENLSFPLLMKRINEGNFREIIIATNPTEEGDTTALYIRHLLKDKPEITLTRLASGLPIGGDLGYADKLTLARSMRGRIRL